MKTPLRLIVLSFLVLSGCMTEHVQPVKEFPDVPCQSTFFVKKVDHDDLGRPLFTEILGDRPKKAGQLFTIVHAVNDRPVRSYDIAILDQKKPDMGKALAIIYEWTGKGFEVGVEISAQFMPYGFSSGREALVFLALKTAPIVICGATGFVVGFVAAVPETTAELKQVIVNAREAVAGYSTYDYDEIGRIRFMTIYSPGPEASELVKTAFFYSEKDREPYKTEVTSVAERKVRVIKEQ